MIDSDVELRERAIVERILLGVGFLATFCSVYWLTDMFAANRDVLFDTSMAWERRIPLLEWSALLYLSISPVMAMGPFIIEELGELRFGLKLLFFELAVAAPIFVLLPSTDVHVHGVPDGPFAPWLELADVINLDYNEVPSLHVAFTVTTAWLYARHRSVTWKWIVALWALLVSLSTLTTHQHHALGVAAGALLAGAATLIFSRKWIGSLRGAHSAS